MFKLLYTIADRVFRGLIFVLNSWERTFASLFQYINEVPVYVIALSGSAVVSGLYLSLITTVIRPMSYSQVLNTIKTNL